MINNKQLISEFDNVYRLREITLLRQSDKAKSHIMTSIDDIRQWIKSNEIEQSETLNELLLDVENRITNLVLLITETERKNRLGLSELFNELVK